LTETPGARLCQLAQVRLAQLSLIEFDRNFWRSAMPTRTSAVGAALAYRV
jgi:hypothetical protein